MLGRGTGWKWLLEKQQFPARQDPFQAHTWSGKALFTVSIFFSLLFPLLGAQQEAPCLPNGFPRPRK